MVTYSAAAADAASGTTSTITAETVTGWHVLKIKRYSQTKGVVVVGNAYSSAAFPVGGHRWRIEYYPDGYTDAVDDWISFDLALDNPGAAAVVRARYVFSLLDRAGAPVPEYTKTYGVCAFSAAVPAWGFEQFIERAELEASPHLGDDDNFSIRCDVTVYKESNAEMMITAGTTSPPSVRSSSSRLPVGFILFLTALLICPS